MNVVFLDIDGVIQPYDNEMRFMYDNNVINELSSKLGVDYTQYDKFDVLAAYYDWSKEALAGLKYILDEGNAKIIISSDWRSIRHPYKMRDFLKIHDMDKYWLCDNPMSKKYLLYYKKRTDEIRMSLMKYPIESFVILDDMFELREYFPDNAVITHNVLSDANVNRSIKILKREK